jgi:hypothetical protein
MSWTLLAEQFCYELSFGVLFALAFVPPAPVGVWFYRLMGTCGALPLGVALVLRVQEGRMEIDPAILGAGLGLLAYPFYSSGAKGRRFPLGLGLAVIGCALATGWSVRSSLAGLSLSGQLLGWLSSLATGTVAGSVGLAMVLGHWYLTVPKLEVGHLARMNRLAVLAMAASLVGIGVGCWFFSDLLGQAEPPLFGPWGCFYLGTRLAVGLILPLVFAAMTASALRYRNTRSATGILYASTVLVLIGTAVSMFLQDSYRVPL